MILWFKKQGSFNPWPSHICWSYLHPPPSAKHVSCLGHCVQLPTVWKSVFSKIGCLFAESYLCNEKFDRQNKIFIRNAIPFSFFHILLHFEFKLRFQAQNAMWLQHPSPILALILCGWGEGGLVIGWPRIKRSLQSHVGGGGQYKMYKSIIFIILISRS